MIDKTLRRAGYNEYKKHRLASWFLSFFLIVVVTMLLVLSFSFTGIIIFIAPIIIFPIVFAAYLSHLGFSHDADLTFKNFFRFFAMYFRVPNNGCFRYWVSLLKFLIATLILETVFTSVAVLICMSLDIDMFIKMMTTYYEASKEALIISNPVDLFGDAYDTFLLFNNIVTIPTALLAGLFIFYLLTFNSLSIYLRLKIRQSNNQFIDLVFKHALKKENHVIRNNFLNLEWPIFVLFIIGATTGSLVSLIFTSNADFIILNGITIGSLSTFFFLPFHFANMEVLFKRYEPYFLNSVSEVSVSLFSKFGKFDKQEKPSEGEDNEKT